MELHLGLEVSADPKALDILGDPPKPGNWKQETYEDKLDELRQKKLESAHNDLRTGIITGAAMTMNKDGKVVTVDVEPDRLSEILRDACMNGDQVAGLGIKYRLMQAIWTGQLRGQGVCLVTDNKLADGYCVLKAERANMLMADFLAFWEPKVGAAVNVEAAVANCKYKDAARQSAVSYGISETILNANG